MNSPRHAVDVLYQDVQQTLPFLQVRLEQAENILNVEDRQAVLDQIFILFKDTDQLFQRLDVEREHYESDDEMLGAIEESREEFNHLWDTLRHASESCEKIISRAQDEASESETLLRATQNTMVNIDLSENLVSSLKHQRETIVNAHEKNAAVQSKLDEIRFYSSRIDQMHDWLSRLWKSIATVLIGIIFVIVYVKWIR